MPNIKEIVTNLNWTLTVTGCLFQGLIIKCLGAYEGARCSSVVRAFAHGVMGHRIDRAWGGPIELFLVPASAPRLV